MVWLVIIVFAVSLLGIIALFGLKIWEERHEATLAPAARRRADLRALELKARLMDARQRSSQVGPFLILLSRYMVHEGALGFARIARVAAIQANRLADFVSHKHRFERQAPRSEFLKAVSERPAAHEYQAPPVLPATPTTPEYPSIPVIAPMPGEPSQFMTHKPRKKRQGLK